MTAAPEVGGPTVITSGADVTVALASPQLQVVPDPGTPHHHEWDVRELPARGTGVLEAVFVCRLCGLPFS